jgi:L-cysteate sulfo-lyase
MTPKPLIDPTRFPQFPLAGGPTPIQRLARLEAQLGDALRGVRLYAKRDDHMPLGGGGGNKLRKLEFLIGQALAGGADTLITMGGLQSNHARLTAAAAARAGLACELMLARPVPRADVDYERNGNVLLDGIFGAKVHDFHGAVDTLALAEERALALRGEGRLASVIPTGGSTPQQRHPRRPGRGFRRAGAGRFPGAFLCRALRRGQDAGHHPQAGARGAGVDGQRCPHRGRRYPH